MEELEKTARELILAITEKMLKSLKDKGLLKAPSNLQMLCTSPEMESLIKKLSAPKYAPCRLLRKGDKVQVKKRDGRCNGKAGEYLREAFCTVAEDETQNELVRVLHNATEYRLDPAYLELVTPVEERVRYRVGDFPTNNEWCVWKDSLSKTEVVSSYKIDTHPHAQAAAEAERDRLNKEHRKEMGK